MIDPFGTTQRFETPTNNMSCLGWSPDDSTLCVLDSALRYKAVLYAPNGHLLGVFEPSDWILGTRSMSWAPSAKFVALGSFDQKVLSDSLNQLYALKL
jgi:hypothetical protein